MDDEYGVLIKKKVWEVILLSPDMNIVGSHWTYVSKLNDQGTARPNQEV